MPVRKLRDLLDKNHVKYVAVSHSPAFTAQEIAQSAHVSGWELAKTVVVKADGRMAMAVLPASRHIDFELLATAMNARQVKLADEREFQDMFGDCEVGAMPPFGNLYDMNVYVAEELAEDDQIAFNAGSHTELFRLAYDDFERLVAPKVCAFTTR